jgi:DNA-binding response OmpR family regulator
LKKTILAIDDDTDILNIISIILKNRGYNVITDTTGNYIENMQLPFPDLIILDIALNGYDGRDICKKLKSYQLTAAIPVLFFSANLDLQHICKEFKADDYLTKPFEIQDLIKKIEKLMVTDSAGY